DEISAADRKTGLKNYEEALGSELVSKLRNADCEAMADEVVAAFSRLAERGGKRIVAGIPVKTLAEGAIFSVRHLRLGKKAEGLEGTSVDGKTIALGDYPGKGVVGDFWATRCGPCEGE